MDKIKLGLFDIFVYILPGSLILLSLDLIRNPKIDYLEDLFTKSKNYTLFQVTLLLGACYLLGFLNQFLSYESFKFLAKRIWKTRLQNKETSIGKLEDKVVMIRHFSPENFNTLNTWLVFRGMCYSLFQACLLLFIILFIISFQLNCLKEKWLDLTILAVAVVLFLRRSVTFHEWVHGTIKNASNNMAEFNK